jgi:trehalose 6-phosphate synthase
LTLLARLICHHTLTLSGTVEFTPIHFLHKSVNFDELIALYAVSDVCVVSSTRDGMNLVAYEYIATQQKRQGVLVLSEFAGAARSLNGSIVVNPWNTEEMAGAYQEAVTMSKEQRALNFSKLEKYVSKYTRYVRGTACLAWVHSEILATYFR